MPLQSILQLTRVIREAREALPRIQQPLLALYGGKDETAPPRHGAWIVERVAQARCQVFPESGHVLPLDVERDAVAEAVRDFLEEHHGVE
jgi:carboxylesterase